MDEVSFTEFKKAGFDTIVQRKSVIVTGDGDFGFIAIVRPSALMRQKLVGIAGLIEAARNNEEW